MVVESGYPSSRMTVCRLWVQTIPTGPGILRRLLYFRGGWFTGPTGNGALDGCLGTYDGLSPTTWTDIRAITLDFGGELPFYQSRLIQHMCLPAIKAGGMPIRATRL